jgi:hypothetical protein
VVGRVGFFAEREKRSRDRNSEKNRRDGQCLKRGAAKEGERGVEIKRRERRADVASDREGNKGSEWSQ